MQRVDDLLVARGAERGHDERLRLAAREQRRAVRARQDAGADGDRAHGARVAAVDARLAGEDLVAHDLGFELEQHVADGARDVGRGIGAACTRAVDLLVDFLQALLARLLLAHLVRGAQVGFRGGGDLGDHRLVLRRRLPVPQRLAAFFDERMDEVDHGLLLLVAEHDRAEHHFLGQLVRFRLDHQHRGFGAGDDEVQLRRRRAPSWSG